MVCRIKLQDSLICGVAGIRWDGFRSNKHKEWALYGTGKGTGDPQIIGIMCSMGFKHTHPDRLIDEPNASPKIKGGK